MAQVVGYSTPAVVGYWIVVVVEDHWAVADYQVLVVVVLVVEAVVHQEIEMNQNY
jgi:hypothetical protein